VSALPATSSQRTRFSIRRIVAGAWQSTALEWTTCGKQRRVSRPVGRVVRIPWVVCGEGGVYGVPCLFLQFRDHLTPDNDLKQWVQGDAVVAVVDLDKAVLGESLDGVPQADRLERPSFFRLGLVLLVGLGHEGVGYACRCEERAQPEERQRPLITVLEPAQGHVPHRFDRNVVLAGILSSEQCGGVSCQ
jgi:hypothetical protein